MPAAVWRGRASLARAPAFAGPGRALAPHTPAGRINLAVPGQPAYKTKARNWGDCHLMLPHSFGLDSMTNAAISELPQARDVRTRPESAFLAAVVGAIAETNPPEDTVHDADWATFWAATAGRVRQGLCRVKCPSRQVLVQNCPELSDAETTSLFNLAYGSARFVSALAANPAQMPEEVAIRCLRRMLSKLETQLDLSPNVRHTLATVLYRHRELLRMFEAKAILNWDGTLSIAPLPRDPLYRARAALLDFSTDLSMSLVPPALVSDLQTAFDGPRLCCAIEEAVAHLCLLLQHLPVPCPHRDGVLEYLNCIIDAYSFFQLEGGNFARNLCEWREMAVQFATVRTPPVEPDTVPDDVLYYLPDGTSTKANQAIVDFWTGQPPDARAFNTWYWNKELYEVKSDRLTLEMLLHMSQVCDNSSRVLSSFAADEWTALRDVVGGVQACAKIYTHCGNFAFYVAEIEYRLACAREQLEALSEQRESVATTAETSTPRKRRRTEAGSSLVLTRAQRDILLPEYQSIMDRTRRVYLQIAQAVVAPN
ncbi:hypothetical protein BKA62DRAFT_674168 [Auriculariales sp. MPI-PUGE-AT-0066]|nr:hypothetical protein BKA62DRAFT_674168 [Auriculariales sp. MPI-PUGE-AT-0066]